LQTTKIKTAFLNQY